MPIRKRWSRSKAKHIEKNVPTSAGVYELKCFGEVVYIGTSTNLRNRLLEHERERSPNKYRYKEVSRGWFGLGNGHVKTEDKLLSQFEKNHGRLPRWNKADTRS